MSLDLNKKLKNDDSKLFKKKNKNLKNKQKNSGNNKNGAKKNINNNKKRKLSTTENDVKEKKIKLEKNQEQSVTNDNNNNNNSVNNKIKYKLIASQLNIYNKNKKFNKNNNNNNDKNNKKNNNKNNDKTNNKNKKKNKNKNKTENTQQNDKSNDNAIIKDKSKLDLNVIEKLLAEKKKITKVQKDDTVPLRERMLDQLRAARFRYINETLYNNNSSESKKLFMEDPDAFKAYHSGYRQQVKQWPLNPLEVIISTIQKMPKDYVIADFGCGDAKLCESVEQKVHSLDLVAVNDKVTACDMAHTSLLTSSVNVVVFCLSLMGKNLADYLLEANRVLKNEGILKIADVESRFEDIKEFVKSLEKYGFQNTYQDLSNNLFYFMDFKKIEDVNRRNKNLPQIHLKTCLYKRR